MKITPKLERLFSEDDNIKPKTTYTQAVNYLAAWNNMRDHQRNAAKTAEEAFKYICTKCLEPYKFQLEVAYHIHSYKVVYLCGCQWHVTVITAQTLVTAADTYSELYDVCVQLEARMLEQSIEKVPPEYMTATNAMIQTVLIVRN